MSRNLCLLTWCCFCFSLEHQTQ